MNSTCVLFYIYPALGLEKQPSVVVFLECIGNKYQDVTVDSRVCSHMNTVGSIKCSTSLNPKTIN